MLAIMNRLYERELGVAIRAVGEAARLCRAVAAEISSEVLAKKDKSPVTVADFGSQALICRALLESFPDDAVIAEEDAAELRSMENRPILDRVLRHVRSVSETSTGERADVGIRARMRLDRPRRLQRVSRSLLDFGSNRRNKGLPPWRAVRRRARFDRRR